MAGDQAAITRAIQIASEYLTAATSIGEVKEIHDQAAAMVEYAKQKKLGMEAEAAAAELRIRAEVRMGRFLLVTPLAKGGRPSETATPGEAVTLATLGLSDKESSLFQQMARIAQPEFERRMSEAKTVGKVTRIAVLRGGKSARFRTELGRQRLEADRKRGKKLRGRDVEAQNEHFLEDLVQDLADGNCDQASGHLAELLGQLFEELEQWSARRRSGEPIGGPPDRSG